VSLEPVGQRVQSVGGAQSERPTAASDDPRDQAFMLGLTLEFGDVVLRVDLQGA
jgi:hypothetical protein